MSCDSSVGFKVFAVPSSLIASELLSSTLAVWPFTGTSFVSFPSGLLSDFNESSCTVTVIGPSTFVPGFTEISPVVGSTVT